jgi:predicted acylesterase/phospholipase RssA
MLSTSQKFITLKFSGCGHLLPYHLGVSSILLDQGSKSISETATKKQLPRIKAVSGSSAGAIAAVCFARMPHRVEEFAERFISERGHALQTLRTMLHQEENLLNSIDSEQFTSHVATEGKKHVPPSLHIATTKCVDGSHHLFHFSGCVDKYSSISSAWTTDKILDAVKASCTIPQSFHPADMIFKSQSISYSDSEGVMIDGQGHVDGGIAAPAPRTPRDDLEGSYPIIISPISVGEPFFNSSSQKIEKRISPRDDSWRLLPISNLNCRGDFFIKPSVQNLRALRMASGLVSSKELQGWYDRGIEDALRLVEDWEE